MDAAGFARKWIASKRTERAASQEHFVDLCRLLDEQTPNEADPTGDFYAFEKGAERTSAGDGFADVWLKDHFGWEYKGKRKNLREAYKQLLDYHEALGQPPLLVVCDLERFEVHTKWTGFESWTYEFNLTHLTSDEAVRVTTSRGEPAPGAESLTALEVLKALWEEPERLRPVRTTEQITRRRRSCSRASSPSCAVGATPTTWASRASSRAPSSACSPPTSGCSRGGPSRSCCGRRRKTPASSARRSPTSSARWSGAGATAPRPSPGSTATSSPTTTCPTT